MEKDDSVLSRKSPLRSDIVTHPQLLMQIQNVSIHRYAAGKLKREKEVTINLLHALWGRLGGLQRNIPLRDTLPPP